jgi:hypothetical protein
LPLGDSQAYFLLVSFAGNAFFKFLIMPASAFILFTKANSGKTFVD